MMTLRDLINKLLGRETSSANTARERLQLVLAHDRVDMSSLTTDLLDKMRKEILDVVAKYVEIDFDEVAVSLETEDRMTALVANLPIKRTISGEIKFKKTDKAKKDYEAIASKYWPGALTMVIPASEKQTTILTSNDLTLGLRVPNSDMAQSLIRETGPLLTSSANISGFKGSTSVEGIALDFPSVKILGPIPWGKRSGKASTIIFWKKSGDWRLIREGEVLVRELY